MLILGCSQLSSGFFIFFLSPLERAEEIKILAIDEKRDPNAWTSKGKKRREKKSLTEDDDEGLSAESINRKKIMHLTVAGLPLSRQ